MIVCVPDCGYGCSCVSVCVSEHLCLEAGVAETWLGPCKYLFAREGGWV